MATLAVESAAAPVRLMTTAPVVLPGARLDGRLALNVSGPLAGGGVPPPPPPVGVPPVVLAHARDRLPSGWVVIVGVVQVTPPGSAIVRADAGAAIRNAAAAARAVAVRRRRFRVVDGCMEVLAFGWSGATSKAGVPEMSFKSIE